MWIGTVPSLLILYPQYLDTAQHVVIKQTSVKERKKGRMEGTGGRTKVDIRLLPDKCNTSPTEIHLKTERIYYSQHQFLLLDIPMRCLNLIKNFCLYLKFEFRGKTYRFQQSNTKQSKSFISSLFSLIPFYHILHLPHFCPSFPYIGNVITYCKGWLTGQQVPSDREAVEVASGALSGSGAGDSRVVREMDQE